MKGRCVWARIKCFAVKNARYSGHARQSGIGASAARRIYAALSATFIESAEKT
jgi:hypothetical protein